MERVLVDLAGTVLEIIVVLVFYETLWAYRKVKRSIFVFGLLLVAVLIIVLTSFLKNTIALPLTSIPIMFCLSLYFFSSITSKVLFSFVIVAVLFSVEQLFGVVFVNILHIPIELVQNDTLSYMVGVLSSKLFSLFIIYILRIIIKGNKQEADRRFNFLMAFMPIQSIILCFIVYNYSISTSPRQDANLGIASIVISLVLVFIIMFMLSDHRKAFEIRKNFELAQFRLKIQLDHYQKLYQSQHELRSIRHDISNNLIAISGMLKDGLYHEAIGRISEISSDVLRTADIVDTGHPAIDAVINAKITRSTESEITIVYKVLIDDSLNISQFDVAAIIASALDNAIEGTMRGNHEIKKIWLNVASVSDYISVVVENFTSGSIFDDFHTSKTDEKNHGFGITQMRSIAQKYNGHAQPSYDQQTGKFTLNILLKNKQI